MINRRDFFRTVDVFRDLCLHKYAEDIDLFPARERDGHLGSLKGNYDLNASISRSLVPGYRQPIDHICNLLKTPRLLKLSFRRILSVWEQLHGEVDYDDLLISTILRFAAPAAYDFLIENIGEMRALDAEQKKDDLAKKNREYLRNRWGRMTAVVEWDVEAAEALIAFLFPAWEENTFNFIAVPQGIRNDNPTDYWRRMNSEFIPAGEIRDQEIIKAIRTWKSHHSGIALRGLSLVEALYSEESSSTKLEQFAAYFLDGKEIRELAASLFATILEREGVKANVDSCPGFVSLWRLSSRKPMERAEDHKEWVLGQILRALPLSLRFANDLYYYYRHNHYIAGDVQTHDLRSLFIDNVRKFLDGNPESLIKIVDPSYMYSFYHFMVLFSGVDRGGPGFNPVEWRWLASLLTAAAKMEPEIVLPQIVPLVIEIVQAVDGREYKFDETRADALFGDHLREMMELLAAMPLNRQIDKDSFEYISFAKQFAGEWLAGASL